MPAWPPSIPRDEQYLLANAQLSLGGIAAGLASNPTLPASVATSAQLIWGPPAEFLSTWEGMVAAAPTTPPSEWNYPAYEQTLDAVNASTPAGLVLSAFYYGPSPAGAGPSGFNGSADCAANLAVVDACATAVVRSTIDALVPILAPDPIDQPVPYGVLANLGLGNFTNATAQHATAIEVLAGSLGLPASWIGTVWGEFPFGTAPTAALSGWVDGIVSQGSPSTYPLAIPAALEGQYVAASGTAELLIVTFSVPDTFTTSGERTRTSPTWSTISTLAPSVLATTDPSGSLGFVQTGGAPLDQTEQTVLSASLAVVLPLTILVLIGITMLYFRAPFAPLVTFGGLGIALALGLGGVVLIGTFITKVDTTALTLQNTFVLGVGTDYSIFLVARYREELWKGADPHEAVVTTVTWAGQLIATSGATAALATLALAFSGVALLSQWGMVLSLAVLLAVLVSLTIIPAFLVLAGPRVFWPVTGERFRCQSAATMQARAEEKTYFYRVARGVRRRPKTVVGLTLLLSIPLLFVALTAPISYDFFAQLPSGHPVDRWPRDPLPGVRRGPGVPDRRPRDVRRPVPRRERLERDRVRRPRLADEPREHYERRRERRLPRRGQRGAADRVDRIRRPQARAADAARGNPVGLSRHGRANADPHGLLDLRRPLGRRRGPPGDAQVRGPRVRRHAPDDRRYGVRGRCGRDVRHPAADLARDRSDGPGGVGGPARRPVRRPPLLDHPAHGRPHDRPLDRLGVGRDEPGPRRRARDPDVLLRPRRSCSS